MRLTRQATSESQALVTSGNYVRERSRAIQDPAMRVKHGVMKVNRDQMTACQSQVQGSDAKVNHCTRDCWSLAYELNAKSVGSLGPVVKRRQLTPSEPVHLWWIRVAEAARLRDHGQRDGRNWGLVD